ncbi:hypothetical protein L6R29_15835 [Myxococcota bacterium]|nr:hypothetical protein [Myxococcota bacterium]
MLKKHNTSPTLPDTIETNPPSQPPRKPPTRRNNAKIATTQVLFELRVWQMTSLEQRMEIWQLPSSLTPNLAEPVRIAGLSGRSLRYFYPQLRQIWSIDRIETDHLTSQQRASFPLSEHTALLLGLVFRILAPMRNRDLMRQCLQGIEAMSKQEVSYWLGMAMHRPKPRRVLKALRILLNETH